ncbi:hypothetical protein [Bdellovibrio sp. NC01]|uniref:hypothetical protein n=1 Tax=Bdellovibrio sp. NC01 TaxID=2220073 RepID=UPI001157256A|nr:hypothetical protein [Bdellovibrio sp. NC01]QDK37102.1 hypothetical protein DOE51_05600 [Bdellovibrio sp. NC01]
MKTKIALMTLLTVVASQSFAAKLACWDLYAKRGDKPTFTADIVRDDELKSFTIQPNQQYWSFVTTDLNKSAQGSEITAKTSPYKGLQEFEVADGIRLILPTNLNSDVLANTEIKAGNGNTSRQNGVLDISPSRFPGVVMGGHGYLRMHCVSK